MVRLFSAAQMRLADRLAAEAGIPGLELMENAGRAVADVAAAALAASTQGSGCVTILAGKGNNGGDGLVAARLLAQAGKSVEVVLSEPDEAFAGDALVNLKALTAGAGGDGLPHPRVFGSDISPAELTALLARSAVIVDALLGTGAEGAPREPVASIIRLANSAADTAAPAAATAAVAEVPPAVSHASRPFVLAVDLPSGFDADTGLAADPCVRADATITLGGLKTGLVQPGAARFVGRLQLADIGIPEACLEQAWREVGAAGPASTPGPAGSSTAPCTLSWLLPAEAGLFLPVRPADGHKGTFGHVWVVAGSPGFTGAAALAALGALRAGAGLATAACPEGCRPIIAASLPEALTMGLPQGSDGRLDERALWELRAALEGDARGHVLVVGPGLGVTPETRSLVVGLLQQGPTNRLPAVFDADALNALALGGPGEVTRLLSERSRASAQVSAGGAGGPLAPPLIITPHPGEMARLIGRSAAEVQADRVGLARQAARAWGTIVVLKGAATVIATPAGDTWLNATGNPGMATGGSGDVLSGAIGAFLAQGLPPLEAALAGVSAHGLAGDLAAGEIGSRGILASDIAHRLPRAIDIMTGTAPGEHR